MRSVDGNQLGIAGPFVPMPSRSPLPTSLEAIAGRLRSLREAKGLKQANCCRLVGIDTNAWNNYERAHRRISIDQALRVCANSGATLDYIYRGVLTGLPMEPVMDLQRKQNMAS